MEKHRGIVIVDGRYDTLVEFESRKELAAFEQGLKHCAFSKMIRYCTLLTWDDYIIGEECFINDLIEEHLLERV